MTLPPALEAKIDEAITHYPVSKRSATLPLLHLIQEHFGFVSQEAIKWIAAKLGIEPINVLELVTFYPMFRQAPAGKTHIRVCRTLSCAMAGSYELMEAICAGAKIERARARPRESHRHQRGWEILGGIRGVPGQLRHRAGGDGGRRFPRARLAGARGGIAGEHELQRHPAEAAPAALAGEADGFPEHRPRGLVERHREIPDLRRLRGIEEGARRCRRRRS